MRTTPDLDRKFLVDPWWLRAAEKKTDDEILSAVERLRRLENWAAGFGDEHLAAYAVRGQIVLLGEYLNDLDAAVANGERAAASYLTASSQFLIREVVGTQYSVRQDWETAEPWFSQALQNASAASTSERIAARMRMAQVVGRRDHRLAVIHLEKALFDARSGDALPYELPQVLGDLGTARWKAGDRSGAVEAWAEAADLLLGANLDDRSLRGLFMILYAAVVYPAMQVRIGRAPIVPVSGEPMQEPRIGQFLQEFAPEAASYDLTYRTQLAMSLAYLVASINDRELARRWAKRANAEAEAQADNDRLSLVAMELLPFSLLDDEFVDAIRLLDQHVLLMREEPLNAIPKNVEGDGAIFLFLLLPFFRVVRIALDDPAAARGILRNVIRTYMTEKIKNLPARAALIELCDHTFDEESPADLAGLYSREELPDVVAVIARVFHSLNRRRSIVERFTDHCTAAPCPRRRAAAGRPPRRR